MVSSFALGVRAFGLVVDTPPRPPVQCVSFDFAWHGTASPFTFSIITGDSPEGSPVESFPGINGPSFRWDSDLPAGTTFFIKIEDATGASATTGSLVMQNGSDDSCLAKGAEPSSSSPPSTVPSPPAQLTSPSTFSPSLTHASSETGFPVAPTSPSQPDPSQATSIAESTQDQSSLGGTATQTAPIAASQIPGASTGNPEAPTGPASARVPSSPSSPTRNVSDPSTSSLTTSDSAGQTLSAGPTNAAAPPSVQQRHAGVLSIGAIVGIALGVAILLCMLLALLIWRRRRRKSPRDAEHTPSSLVQSRTFRCIAEAEQTSKSKEGKAASSADPMSSSEHAPPTRTSECSMLGTTLVAASAIEAEASECESIADRGATGEEPPRTSLTTTTKDASIRRAAQSTRPGVAPGQECTPSEAPGADYGLSRGTDTLRTSDARREASEVRARAGRERIYETDGGVRLAGGHPDDVLDSSDSSSDVQSVLPPPYSRY